MWLAWCFVSFDVCVCVYFSGGRGSEWRFFLWFNCKWLVKYSQSGRLCPKSTGSKAENHVLRTSYRHTSSRFMYIRTVSCVLYGHSSLSSDVRVSSVDTSVLQYFFQRQRTCRNILTNDLYKFKGPAHSLQEQLLALSMKCFWLRLEHFSKWKLVIFRYF